MSTLTANDYAPTVARALRITRRQLAPIEALADQLFDFRPAARPRKKKKAPGAADQPPKGKGES